MSDAGISQRLAAILAADVGHLGQHEGAHRQWARALAINPGYSLADRRVILPYRDSAVIDRMVEGLGKAGSDSGEGARAT